MSNINNVIRSEFFTERNQGAFTRKIPEDTLYTDTYYNKIEEAKEQEELNKWEEGKDTFNEFAK